MALSIVGRLLFDGKRWKNGLQQAEQQAKVFGKGLPAAMGIGNIAKGLAGAFTATAALGAANRLIESADELQKAAQSVGLTSEEFGKLAFAADLSGVNMEQLTTGISQFSRVLSDAASGQGGSALAASLERMGISAEKFMNLGVVDQFKELSRALSGKTVDTQLISDVQRLFGESGRRMIPFLQSDMAGAIAEGTQLGAFKSNAAVDQLVGSKDEIAKLKASLGAMATEGAAAWNLLGRLQTLTGTLKVTRQAMAGGISPSQMLQANAATISALNPAPISQETSAAAVKVLNQIRSEMEKLNESHRRAFE